MLHYCQTTGTPVTATKNSDGQWTVEGIGGMALIEQVLTTETVYRPYNTTFSFTTEVDECFAMLKNNMSQATSVFTPIHDISAYYYVQQPLFAGKLRFITGYNVTDGVTGYKDNATVASNADLLEIEVYLWCLALLVSFVTFIAIRVTMLYQQSLRETKSPLMTCVRREWSRMFYYESSRFRLITLLYSLLCFYMVTSFLCLYKTSHIIVEKPFYAKSYQESLDHPSSLAFYYDQFSVVSTRFKEAPPNSLRGKLWAKLIATGRQDDYAGSNINPANLPIVLKKGSEEMTVRRGICLASPAIAPLVKSLACGFSPENELWIVKSMFDAIEEELIYGHAIGSSLKSDKHLAARLRNVFETHVMIHSYDRFLNVGGLSSDMVGTSKRHRWRQSVVCEHEKDDAFAQIPAVHGIHVSYFASFFEACMIVWLFAFIINLCQIACCGKKKQKTRHHQSHW